MAFLIYPSRSVRAFPHSEHKSQERKECAAQRAAASLPDEHNCMKKTLFALLAAAGVTRLVAWLNRRRVAILCYHSVTPRPEGIPRDPHKLHLDTRRFISHLEHLRRRHHVISLAEYVAARREGRRLPSGSVVLTFDDGYRNFLTVIAPLLAERGFSATVFVVTNKADAADAATAQRVWAPADDRTYLSWSEIERLTAAGGVEFGSHTCSHPRLDDVEPQVAERELRESRAALARHLPGGCAAFSYPHGRSTPALSELTRTVGYDCALTTVMGLNGERDDLHALRRVVIAADDDAATFAARVSGLTWRLHTIRARLGLAAAARPEPVPCAVPRGIHVTQD